MKNNSISFFTKDDYERLTYKFLDRDKYDNFIRACNKRIAKEIIVGTKEGWEMPGNLGLLRVGKRMGESRHKVTQEIYDNSHTFGYVYGCTNYRKGRKVYYTPKYYRMDKRQYTREVRANLYKFNNHRANIDRYLASVLFEGLMDYNYF